MKRILLLTGISFLINVQCVTAQDFEATPISFSNLGSVWGDLEWVDLDGDGDLDAVTANWVDKVKTFKNDNGTLVQVGVGLGNQPFSYNDQLRLVDFDDNGYMDVLLSGGGKVHALLNQGNFDFVLQPTGIDFVSTRSTPLDCIDIDADADLDIILDGRIFLNTNGTFAESIVAFPDISKYTWGDINNDGIIDLIDVNYNTLVPYIGQGSGVFTKGTEFGSIRSDGTFFLVDADGDGDLDIQVSESNYTRSIFRNSFKQNGKAEFERAYTFPVSGGIATVSPGDVNSDGLVDFVVYGLSNINNTTTVLLNTSSAGQMSFTTGNFMLTAVLASNPIFVDFDNDGDLDIHLSTSNPSGVGGVHKIYLNQQASPVTPAPQVPANPQTITGDDVTLKWDAAPHTFYSIEIEQNGVKTLPSSSMDDGTLMIPFPAQPAMIAEHKLKNLPAGNYRWRVQAVDYASRASAFTAYQDFTIEAGPLIMLSSNDFTQVNLSYQQVGIVTGFAIYRRSTKEPWKKIFEVPMTMTSLVDNTLVLNETYEYFVKSVNGTSYSAPSIVLSHYAGQFKEAPFARRNPNIIVGGGGVADIDSDGDYDLQVVGRVDWGNETAMDNDGAGNFSMKSYLPDTGTDWDKEYSGLLFMGDMDSDGDIDMCVRTGDTWGMKIQVFSNNGGTFSKSYESPAINYMYDYEVKDFNNDGLIDIFFGAAVSSGSGYYYKFLIQKRDGSFSSEILSIGSEPSVGRWFKTVDINNDGFLDLFFGGTDYPNTKAMLAISLNGRAFQVKETAIFSYSDLIFQDLNADGFLDLLYRHADNRLVMHLGQGNEVFGDPVFFRAFYLNGTSLASADLDFNGWPELILYDGYNLGVMQNNGNGAFEVAPYKFPGRWGTFVHLLDIENDGDLDIVRMANDDQHQGLSSLYTNQWRSGQRTNTPPTAPATVTSTIADGLVKIQWQSSTDNTTPSKLISYNVLIVDANGKSWVHPGTNAAGTWRNVTGQGNAGNRLFFFINELPAGTYTAKVQALDASFAPSGWSEPHSFTIAAGPTGLTVERILLNKVKLQWTAGTAGADHVIVERKTPSTDYEVVAELGAGSLEYTDAGLKYNQLFTYRVRELIGDVPTTHSNTATWNTALWEFRDTSLPNADGAMDVGDFNADSRMDLLLAGYYSDGNNYTRVKAAYANTESGFVATNFGNVIQPASVSAFFEDLNMDGTLDIYEHGWSNGYQTNLYTRNGATFNAFTNIVDTDNLEILSGIDYDMDNDLDLYVAAKPYSGYPSAKMLQNTGSSYQAVTALASNCQGYYCTYQGVAGDFDRDGDEDIITGYTSGFSLSLNTRKGFQGTNITFGTTAQGYASVLDFNGDGWLDVLFLSSDGYYHKSKLYKNLGLNTSQNLQFEEVKVTLPAGSNAVISNNVADFDNDGDLDLVFAGPEITMLLNDNNGGFETAIVPNFRVSGKSKSIDYDNDGDLDVIFTGFMSENYNSLYSTVAKVLENKLIDGAKGISNNAPAAPVNLRFYQTAEGLNLEWDAPQDDHTPSAALTYDVVLYKGGVPVYKNYLDPSTGARKKLAAGRSVNKVLLNNIVNGDYEWKVQAIDQNYLASPFSDVKPFNMLPPPPGVKDTTIYRCNRTVTLTAKGENIQWYSDVSATNLLASGTFSPATSQKVYVTQTIGGVKGVAAEVNITIIERPGKPDLVQASPVYYCNSVSNNVIYLMAKGENLSWYSDSNLLTKVATGGYYYAPAKPARYFITQSFQQCQSLPAELAIDSIGIDSRIVLEQDRLRIMEEKADHFVWYRNGTPIASGPSNSIPFDGTTGQYRAVVYKRGCYEGSGPFLVTGIEEETPGLISIYPNPATHETTIRLTPGAHLQIYSGEGRLVYTQENASENELKLSVSAWQKGIYAVVISDGNRSHVRKLVIR